MPIIAEALTNDHQQYPNTMKKTSLLRILAIFTFVFTMGFLAQAQNEEQTTFKCVSQTYCLLDDNYDVESCDETEKKSSTFVFNEDITAVTHTTKTNETIYYITNSEYDEEDNSFTFEVTSENGNDYIFFIFPDDNQISVLYVDDEGDTWIAVFEIDSIY